MTRALLAAGWCGLCSPLFGQMLPFDVAARTGDAAPGGGGNFTSIGANPRIGPNGHVSFNAFAPSGGYWVGTPGSLNLVAYTGTPLPGDAATYLSGLYANVRADGNVAFGVQMSQNSPPDTPPAIYSGLPGGGAAALVARKGNQAPGYDPGQNYSSVGIGPASNAAGGVSFLGSVVNGGTVTSANDQAVWAGVPGSVSLVVREGQAAPGASGPAPVFGDTGGSNFALSNAINAAGQVAFTTRLLGAGSNSTAIYVHTPGTGLALATQIGMAAPGTSPTVTFSNYFNGITSRPGFNDAGQVAFIATLTSDVPGEITLTNGTGVWAGAPGGVQLVVRSGTASPIAGLQFRSPTSDPRINAAGQVAFTGLVAGGGVTTANDQVVWRTTAGAAAVIAREGDQAPGTAAGVNFGTIDATPALNAQGTVAFTAGLTGIGVTAGNNRGLWAGQPGAVSLIALTGEVIDIDPTAGVLLRTIASISFANGHSTDVTAGNAALNDANQLAWQATFVEGGSAVFVTTTPVPEPAAVLALPAALLVAGFLRRIRSTRPRPECCP